MSSSPSVTPQRRRRADSESESGSTTFESATSQARKRPRLHDDISQHDHDHDEQDEDAALLPDSYRRSPKGKGRAIDVLQEHHPGSIVRVTMKTFVTYTHAEFLPGPNLNMIIGPNGTGKSTLVCAICLGLGWKPEHLGRAKDIAEFVKHGAREATIEIELKADTEIHSTNPIITCIINREGGKSDDKKTTFKINGKKSTRKAVQELVKNNYSIQVDNLCQFLPQDRVVEFAALSPVELLVQTQRAAAEPSMSKMHEDLKEMRKDQRQKQADNQSLLETLKALEDRHKGQAEQVEKMRRKEESVARLKILEKLRPVPEYTLLAQRHSESKSRRDGAKRELAQLKDRVAPNLQSMNHKKTYHDQLEKVVGHRTRLLGNVEKAVTEAAQKITSTDEEIKKCGEEATAEKQGAARAKQNILKHQNEIRDLERGIANPPEPFDPAEINEQVQEKTTEIRKLAAETDDTKSTLDNLRLQGQQRQQIIADLDNRKDYLQSQAGKQSSALQKISRDSATAWDWIQDNRREFSGEIYAPPMISCSIRDPNRAHHTDWVEAAIGEGDMKAFTVTNSEDFNKLTHQLQEVMRLKDITVRNSRSSLQSIKHPLSDQALKQIGLDGWVQDLLEGPDPVIAMLCDNRNLHIAAYAHKEITTQENQDAIVRTALTSWYTPTKSYMVARRRDLGKESTRSTFLNKAKCFIDAPVDTQAEQDINNKQSEVRDEIEEIKTEIRGVMTRDKSLKQQIEKLKKEKEELSDSKSEKQKQQTLYQGLHTKLTNTKKKLEEAEGIVAAVYGRVDAILEKEMDLALQKGQQSLDYARRVCTLQKTREELFEVEIMRIEAQSDYVQFQSQNDEERKQLAERETEVERLTTVTRELKNEGQRLGRIVQTLVDELTEAEREVHMDEIQGKMPEDLETLIEAQKADIDMIGVTGGANTLKEYEDRAQKIEDKRAKLQTLEVDLEKLDKEITKVRGRWEPELDELIGQISDAFSENFSRIQCAGEVAIHKDEDFEQWAIQIKVKFRENESLSILDSHRQSGGERAVSTIFYLMALQSLARAPFRVVDEINQGMDPRNERLVHSRMVDIACAEHTAQYFLITPKLLNGLKYHKNMKVHCIASGEYMPSSTKGQALETFEEMAERALAIRNAA